MLARLGARLRARTAEASPLTNVYGLGRTLVALGTLGTLVFTDTADLFRPAVGVPEVPNCPGVARTGLFCLAGEQHLHAAHWLAIAALVVVASGWRPRVTGVLHWYVAMSVFTSALMVDGGDQVTAILSFMLLPITLADGRRWHWDAPEPPPLPGTVPRTRDAALRLVALSCLFMIRLQMAGIYFQASVSKMKVPEWENGTALYYWFTDPWFGLSGPLRRMAMPLLANGFAVSLGTWGAMVLEIFLFAGIVATPRAQRVLLALGIAFHAAIAAVHGLPSFALAMWGGLVMYLLPVNQEIAWLRARADAVALSLAAFRARLLAPRTPAIALEAAARADVGER